MQQLFHRSDVYMYRQRLKRPEKGLKPSCTKLCHLRVYNLWLQELSGGNNLNNKHRTSVALSEIANSSCKNNFCSH